MRWAKSLRDLPETDPVDKTDLDRAEDVQPTRGLRTNLRWVHSAELAPSSVARVQTTRWGQHEMSPR